MVKHHVIELGGRTWTVDSPLRLGQLRIIEPLITSLEEMKAKAETEFDTDKFYEVSTKIILAVFSAIDPKFDAEALDNTSMTSADLNEAIKQIAFASGLWRPVVPGEAKGQTPPNPDQV